MPPTKIHTHPIFPFLQFLTLIFLSDFLTIFFTFFADFSPNFFGFSREMTILIFFLAVKIFISFWIFLKWIFDFYFIENGVLIHRRGIFFPHISEFIIREIENISYSSGFFGKLFGFGRVSIRFANEKFEFRRIPDPSHFVELLHAHQQK